MNYTSRITNIATDPRRYRVRPSTGCWIWRGATFRSGHAVVKVCGKSILAYRAFYEFYKGPIPLGTELHHTCWEPACVNPDHVVPLTRRQHACAHAKLDFHKAREIRRLYADGWTQQAIADVYGVDQTTVSSVIRNVTWVDGEETETAAKAA